MHIDAVYLEIEGESRASRKKNHSADAVPQISISCKITMNKGRILIVDDQEEILESLGAILTDEGHEVISARDGQEALHMVHSDSPDVVFLDIWIPGIDGMQTLKAIKRIDPRCSVIMMSGHGTIETAVKAIKLGAADYLEKPLNLEDVLHLVDRAVSNRSSSSQTPDGNNWAPGQFIGKSDKATNLRHALAKAAAGTGAVWLAGEKGTGKEFLARMIHHLGGKDRATLVKVRCTDLTAENIEDMILVRNGWVQRTDGSLPQTMGGTLLLIRVDRLERSLRPRLAELIRVLTNRKVLSAPSAIPTVGLVSTSLNDPATLVQGDDFPQELADLLGQRLIRLPNLRERPEDIPLLVNYFLKEAVEEFDRNLTGTDRDAMARLCSYTWPGNIKELKILIEHMAMTAPGPLITLNDLLIPGWKEESNYSTAQESPFGTTLELSEHSATDPHVTLEENLGPLNQVNNNNRPQEGSILRQKTLRGRVVIYGQGLHSGVKTGLTLSPLPPSSGIIFGHITSGDTVPAILHNVESTGFSTSLKRNGSLARTIEHLMAVFHVYGLTNVLVKISGEVPIMDGSALDFCNLVENAEIITQEDPVQSIQITEPIELPMEPGSPKKMRIEPSDCLEVEYYLDYPPPVGSLHMVFRCKNPEEFKKEIAPARTFGFVKDMRMMDEMGLAGGGRLSNVVLIDDEKVINPPLRFSDEFVRHKILDIIGDFYLLGRPFTGKIIARLTGHTENIEMLKVINRKMKIL